MGEIHARELEGDRVMLTSVVGSAWQWKKGERAWWAGVGFSCCAEREGRVGFSQLGTGRRPILFFCSFPFSVLQTAIAV